MPTEIFTRRLLRGLPAATLEEAVAGWAAVPGSERDARALVAKNSLANVMADQNELPGARALYEAVVEGYEAMLGGEAPDTLDAKGGLANVMNDQGDLAGAWGLYEAVAEAKARRLGPRHPSTLVTKYNLAIVMADQGDLPGARAVYEAVAEAQTQQLGPIARRLQTAATGVEVNFDIQTDAASLGAASASALHTAITNDLTSAVTGGGMETALTGAASFAGMTSLDTSGYTAPIFADAVVVVVATSTPTSAPTFAPTKAPYILKVRAQQALPLLVVERL